MSGGSPERQGRLLFGWEILPEGGCFPLLIDRGHCDLAPDRKHQLIPAQHDPSRLQCRCCSQVESLEVPGER